MKDDLNLINREERREVLSLCIDQGTAAIPWSPLARGRLTRALSSNRVETDVFTVAVDSLMKTPSCAMMAPHGWINSRGCCRSKRAAACSAIRRATAGGREDTNNEVIRT